MERVAMAELKRTGSKTAIDYVCREIDDTYVCAQIGTIAIIDQDYIRKRRQSISRSHHSSGLKLSLRRP